MSILQCTANTYIFVQPFLFFDFCGSIGNAVKNETKHTHTFYCSNSKFTAWKCLTLKQKSMNKLSIQKHIHVEKVLNWKTTLTKLKSFNRNIMHIYRFYSFFLSFWPCSLAFYVRLYFIFQVLIKLDVLKHKADFFLSKIDWKTDDSNSFEKNGLDWKCVCVRAVFLSCSIFTWIFFFFLNFNL